MLSSCPAGVALTTGFWHENSMGPQPIGCGKSCLNIAAKQTKMANFNGATTELLWINLSCYLQQFIDSIYEDHTMTTKGCQDVYKEKWLEVTFWLDKRPYSWTPKNRRRNMHQLNMIYSPGWLESMAKQYRLSLYDMDDIRQEAATKYYKARKRLIGKPENIHKAYLQKIVQRCVMDHFRSRKRQPPTRTIADNYIPLSARTIRRSAAQAEHNLCCLREQVLRLPLPVQQRSDFLRRLDGASYHCIASQDSRSITAVRQSICRAKQNLSLLLNNL